MNVILEKDGHQIEYKSGAAIYLLLQYIPGIGSLIVLVMMILRKQFRGIWLNQLIFVIITSAIYSIIVVGSSDGSGSILLSIMSVVLMFLSFFLIYMNIMYILNANYYSIRQRLEEGYIVQNMDDPQVALAVTRANSLKPKRIWQFTRF